MKKKFLLLSFLILCLSFKSFSLVAEEFNYKNFVQQFNALEKVNNENFNGLKFTYSDNQIKHSATYKIVVRDQFNQDWLFKSGPHSSKDGAVAIYRLFLLFGVPTPEIHYKTFLINGETVDGSLQKVYGVKPTQPPLTLISQKGQMYIAKNHALAWLTLNHHTHPKQFIYLANPVNGLDILRIDNSVNWFLINNDLLSTGYYSPLLLHVPNAGYFAFWNDFLAYDVYKVALNNKNAPVYDQQSLYIKLLQNKSFELDLNQLYAWISFVAQIPDETYGSFFDEIVKNDFNFSSNGSITTPWFLTSEYMPGFDKKGFIKNMILRKKHSNTEFQKFYGHIAKLKNYNLNIDHPDMAPIQKEMTLFIEQEMMEAEKLKINIAKTQTDAQKEITADISLSTHIIVSKILILPYASTIQDRMSILNEIQTDLKTQLEKKKNTPEKILLINALDNLTKIKQFLEKPRPQFIIANMLLDYHPIFEKNTFDKLRDTK